jgi:hypothetical protein
MLSPTPPPERLKTEANPVGFYKQGPDGQMQSRWEPFGDDRPLSPSAVHLQRAPLIARRCWRAG